jgi:mono/diheme cytochrome c family protein
MKKPGLAAIGFSLLGLWLSARPQARQPAAKTDADSAVVKQYCVGCHNDRAKTGGLSLSAFDVPAAGAQAQVAERVIRKLRAGMMPPPGARRPDEATLRALAEAL